MENNAFIPTTGDGWILPPTRCFPAHDYYPANHSKVKPIEAVILHYTASKNFRGTLKWLARADTHYVSAHFTIARDGLIFQQVPVTGRAWHAGGRSSHLYGKPNVNGRTLGIELMNLGPVDPKTREENLPVTYVGEKLWESYTLHQLSALDALMRRLSEEVPLLKMQNRPRLVGHSEVDPLRKVDPGPHFPWPLFDLWRGNNGG